MTVANSPESDRSAEVERPLREWIAATWPHLWPIQEKWRTAVKGATTIPLPPGWNHVVNMALGTGLDRRILALAARQCDLDAVLLDPPWDPANLWGFDRATVKRYNEGLKPPVNF